MLAMNPATNRCQAPHNRLGNLSMVRTLTRFLAKNRFNLALSRIRRKVIMLVDLQQFLKLPIATANGLVRPWLEICWVCIATVTSRPKKVTTKMPMHSCDSIQVAV